MKLLESIVALLVGAAALLILNEAGLLMPVALSISLVAMVCAYACVHMVRQKYQEGSP